MKNNCCLFESLFNDSYNIEGNYLLSIDFPGIYQKAKIKLLMFDKA